MDDYMLIISVHRSGCQSPAHPARCYLIYIGRLRRREGNEARPACWWWRTLMNGALSCSWHLCKCLITFEWITVRLSGLGPKPRHWCSTGRQSLTAVPWQNGGSGWGGGGGGSVCLCRVVKMFEKLIHFVEYLWFLKNKACGWWHQDESRYGRKKKKQTSGQKVDGKTIAFFKLFSIFFPSFCNCDFFFLSHHFYFSSEFQGYLMGCWESHNQTAINFPWLL